MATTNHSSYNDLCRLCAIKTGDNVGAHIFHAKGPVEHLRKKIESCLPIHVHESDDLPKLVCGNCLYKLDMFFEFREHTARTEKLLLDLINDLPIDKSENTNLDDVGINNCELSLVAQQELLNDNNLANEIGLDHLDDREPIINEQEVILSQHVNIESHSLDNIDLDHHELTNQSLSNHSSILVDTTNSHNIDATSFDGDHLVLIHQDQLLTNQFNLSSALNNAVDRLELPNELRNTELKENRNNNDDSYFKLPNSNSVCKLPPKTEMSTDDLLFVENNLNNDVKSKNASVSETTINANKQILMYCMICGRIFQNATSFDNHYEMHFEKCQNCLELFMNIEELNAHRREAHNAENDKKMEKVTNENVKEIEQKNDDDDDDEEVENNNADTTENPDNVNKKKSWTPKVCQECGKSYKTNYKLAEHMRRHTGEKPFKCKTCDKEFRSKIGLAQHEAKHTGEYDFSCPICGKGFQCKSYLMVHQRVHSNEKPYPCTTCGRNFKTKQSLQDHTNRHLGVKPYTCEICGRSFITKGLCRSHQKVHSGLDNRKYSCKICQKKFVSKSYLQTHLRIHTGEKPYICEVCGKGFLTKVDLRIHTTMHTGEKSYVCEMCGKAFARRHALRCHRRSHTGERPYSCDLCGQSFTQFTPMAIHKRLHTGERPYSCEDCGKKFVSKSTMMAHAKKHLR